MAEGYLRYYACDKARIYSAGTETHGLNPKAVTAMAEDGIDISNHSSNNINEYVDIDFDFILSVCDNAKENCPFFPSKAKKIHFNFPDPAKATGTDEDVFNEFRKVRQMIKEYSKEFADAKL